MRPRRFSLFRGLSPAALPAGAARANAVSIAVDGNPQRNASHLQRMRMVMKQGHLACLADCLEPASVSPAAEPSK